MARHEPRPGSRRLDLLRTFLAIAPGDALRARIEGLVAGLPACFGSSGLRWVRPENYHLTLVFLGATRPGSLPPLREAVAAVAARLRPVRFVFDRVEPFPRTARPRVLALLPRDPEPLRAWQAPLAEALVPLGFPAEPRAFRPHLSLARVRGRPGSGTSPVVTVHLEAEARDIVLFESAGGAYRPLFGIPCAAAEDAR